MRNGSAYRGDTHNYAMICSAISRQRFGIVEHDEQMHALRTRRDE